MGTQQSNQVTVNLECDDVDADKVESRVDWSEFCKNVVNEGENDFVENVKNDSEFD